MYSLSGYGTMLDDGVRLQPYVQALRKTVRPGSVVLEIGTGPGVFAVLACQLGASRVYAVEPSPVIQVAREIAAANGCAERIEFIEGRSTHLKFPIQADVIVSDLRGILPLFQTHLPSIADARRRFLKPGGALIPKRDAIWASVVEGPEQYARIVDCWEKNPLRQDLASARRLAVNDFYKSRFSPEQLLAPPQLWAALDYHTLESADVSASLRFTTRRAGDGHGLVLWFDACLADGIGFSNAPDKPEAVYGSMFLPWTEPVSLAEGTLIAVDLAAALVDNDYLWRWTTDIGATAGAAKGPRFEQSQIGGAMISLDKLRRSASDYVPQISEDGRIHRRVLDLMDGRRSLEEIARVLAAEFPQRFTRWQRALSHAAKISQDLGQ